MWEWFVENVLGLRWGYIAENSIVGVIVTATPVLLGIFHKSVLKAGLWLWKLARGFCARLRYKGRIHLCARTWLRRLSRRCRDLRRSLAAEMARANAAEQRVKEMEDELEEEEDFDLNDRQQQTMYVLMCATESSIPIDTIAARLGFSYQLTRTLCEQLHSMGLAMMRHSIYEGFTCSLTPLGREYLVEEGVLDH